MSPLRQQLRALGACASPLAWLDAQPDHDPQVLWDACPDGSWLLWALGRAGTPLPVAWTVRQVLPLALRSASAAAADAGLPQEAAALERHAAFCEGVSEDDTLAAAAADAARAACADAAAAAAGAARAARAPHRRTAGAASAGFTVCIGALCVAAGAASTAGTEEQTAPTAGSAAPGGRRDRGLVWVDVVPAGPAGTAATEQCAAGTAVTAVGRGHDPVAVLVIDRSNPGAAGPAVAEQQTGTATVPARCTVAAIAPEQTGIPAVAFLAGAVLRRVDPVSDQPPARSHQWTHSGHANAAHSGRSDTRR